MATDSSVTETTTLEEYCELVNREDSQIRINLIDKERTILNAEGFVSKETSNSNEVELCLDLCKKELTVVCLGNDGCCIAGGKIMKNSETITLGPGAIIKLNNTEQVYMVFFAKRAITISTTCTVPVKRQLEHETNSKAVKPLKKSNIQSTLGKFFFSSSPPVTCKWKSVNSLRIMTCGEQIPSSLIASFDLDGTLTDTKSGRLPFRTTPDDWKFWHSCVPKKLHTIHSSGYRLVIFTNQGGMNYGNPPLDEFKVKIQAFMESIGGLPLLLIAATGDDDCRKPSVGMWEYFLEQENQLSDGSSVDMEQSYYIGDAAGRVKHWKTGCKKDWSCSDRKYAANIGLPFHTPDEFFLGEPPTHKFDWDGFNPFTLDYTLEGPTLEPPGAVIVSTEQEIVLYVGSPASGKTTFYQTHMSASYRHVNRDTLGTWEKCVAETERLLSRGCSVVIDNTNPDIAARSRYLQVIKATGRDYLKARCFLFQTSQAQCIHTNRYRELIAHEVDSDLKPVPNRAFYHYQSQYQDPTLDEGFDEIVRITVNMRFTNNRFEQTYKKFYN